MLQLCRTKLQTELSVTLKYHPQLYDQLQSLMETSQVQQIKRLGDIHDREVVELKKKLDAQSRDEMKSLAKKHKDKFELQRCVLTFGLTGNIVFVFFSNSGEKYYLYRSTSSLFTFFCCESTLIQMKGLQSRKKGYTPQCRFLT